MHVSNQCPREGLDILNIRAPYRHMCSVSKRNYNNRLLICEQSRVSSRYALRPGGVSGTRRTTRGQGTLSSLGSQADGSTEKESHRIATHEWNGEAAVDPQTAEYSLNFLWLDKNLAVSVDQVFGRGHRSPVTEYFFWPREDAWERLKSALEGMDWIDHQDKVALLNTCTEVINYWQTEDRPSVQDAIAKYPHCSFQG